MKYSDEHSQFTFLIVISIASTNGILTQFDDQTETRVCSTKYFSGYTTRKHETSHELCGVDDIQLIDTWNQYSRQTNEDWTELKQTIEIAEREYNSSLETAKKEHKCSKESCACYNSRIQVDLAPFVTGITLDLIQKGTPRGVLYQIRNGQLYRDRECKFPARCSGVEHFLLEILSDLPDMELIINVSDYPQVAEWSNSPSPIFSFSKTRDFLDIMYPAWSFWAGGPSISIFPTGLGRWDKFRNSISDAAKIYSWRKKKPVAFFRGSRTSPERDPLVLLSRKEEALVNAQYTKNQAWKSNADTLGAEAASEVTLEYHCQFKYLFNFRGVGASFRFKHLFLCRSLVFHVGDEWDEFFYFLLKPWIHYIPVRKQSTMDELRTLIKFAQFHDEIAQKIANRGYAIIKNYLTLFHIKCYWKALLLDYAKLLRYKIKERKEMIRIVNH